MEYVTLFILVILALAAVRLRDLLGATAVLGAYSLMMALLWCLMDALDVAFTEAAVGAGISTVLMLVAVGRIGRRESGTTFGPLLRRALLSVREEEELVREGGSRSQRRARVGALLVCVLMAAALLYGAQDMPKVGDRSSPANEPAHVAQYYIAQHLPDPEDPHGPREPGAENMVTSVLGDYRGHDTLGETVVILTAALCVLLLLRHAGGAGSGSRRRGGRRDDG